LSIASRPVDIDQPETFLGAIEAANPATRCLAKAQVGLLIEGIDLGASDGVDVEEVAVDYAIVQAAPGSERVYHGMLRETYACCETDHRWPELVRAFDYDGDGTPELIFTTVHEEGAAGEGATAVETFLSLVALRGDAIVPLPALGAVRFPVRLAETAELAPDIDGDGRPDALTWFDYEIPPGCFYETGGMLRPAFALHADPGGRFLGDDAAALAFARSWCPRPPTRPLAEVPGRELAAEVICARLWGASADEVGRALDSRCSTREPEGYRAGEECVDTRERSTCGSWIFRIAEKAPPLDLGHSPTPTGSTRHGESRPGVEGPRSSAHR
jgi:hypothetical protein